MLGSIIGDIVGSVYEFANIKTKEFEFFNERGSFTDDSVLTVATADWLLNGGNVAHYYARYGAQYRWPMGGYGSNFQLWLARANRRGDYRPYNSCGNGSAMRVGPVGWAFDTKEEVMQKAAESAACTHNHPEGIRGAQATALAIFLARTGGSKDDIRAAIEQEIGYDLSFTCDEIRPTYTWGGLCQTSVPQAIVAFLDGNDFEDCIRNAISIGGDSDTIGCITGSIAEAFYGIPNHLRRRAVSYLPAEMRHTVAEFEQKYQQQEADDRRITPHHIRQLAPGEVFVFGSNAQGYHGGGAARTAMDKFGAVWGQGEGLQGSSYAIPTMEGRSRMAVAIGRFIDFASAHPDLHFLVTPIGCGIAGYRFVDVAPLVRPATALSNVSLPAEFWDVLQL